MISLKAKITSYVLFFALFGCVVDKGKVEVDLRRKNKTSEVTLSAHVSSVQILNHQLVITGSNLNSVKQINVKDGAFTQGFVIESQSSTQIVANAINAFSFDVAKIFSLVLSDANASATYPIDFSLCQATLNGKGFSCTTAPNDKEVLSYDGVSKKWTPRSVNGLSYNGAWSALDPEPTGADPGDYYIVSVASGAFNVGDWIVWNGSHFDQINNSQAIVNVFGRTGAVSAQKGDYDLNKLFDVDLTTPPTTGKVLKYDGTKWIAGDDVSGGGAGSVTSTELANGSVTDAKIVSVSASKITGTITSSQIADGTIVNADISGSAAIDYSKINVPNGSITYSKLSIADGDIPAVKITGLPVLSSILAASIVDGDTAHAPDGNAVFDALAGKMGLTGGTLSMGTISGVPTPVNPSDVTNKSYVDNLVSTAQGSSGQWTKAASDIYFDTGKVGIGTNSPTQLLEIGSTTQRGTLRVASGVSNSPPALSLYDGRAGGRNWVLYSGGADGNSSFRLSDVTNSVDRLTIDGTSTQIKGELRLQGATSGHVGFLPAANAGSTTYTLPIADGGAGTVLSTSGLGVLSWVAFPSAPVTTVNSKSGTVVLNSDDLGEGTTHLYFTNARVLGGDLTGYNIGADSALSASDTVLQALEKLQGQVSAVKTDKEPAITNPNDTTKYYRGDKTWQTLNTTAVSEGASLYFTNSRVLGVPLVGFVVPGSVGGVTASDSILSAFGKTQGQLDAIASGYVSKDGVNVLTGSSSVQGMTARLTVPTPLITDVSDATNVQYVQSAISNAIDANGIWSKSGSDISYNSGAVSIGSTLTVNRSNNDSTSRGHILMSRGNASGSTASINTENTGSNDVSAVTFHIQSLEKMRLTSSGNLGIGTTNPSQKLHVLGDQQVESGDVKISRPGSGSPAISMGRNNGEENFRIQNDPSAQKTTMSQWNGASLKNILTLYNGNAGVGTSSPGALLNVYKDLGGAGGGVTVLKVEAQNTADNNYNLLDVYHGASNVFRLTGGGRLGIGTSSPNSVLNASTSSSTGTVLNASFLTLSNRNSTTGTFVAGGMVSDTYRDISNPSYTAGVWFEKQNSATSGATASQGAIVFGTQDLGSANLPTERMRIDSSGNVGISTSDSKFGDSSLSANARYLGLTGDGSEVGSSTGRIILANNRPTATAGDNLGSIIFKSVKDINSTGATIQTSAGSTSGTYGFGGNITFSTKNPATGVQERMRVTEEGRLGVGISSPTSLLHTKSSSLGSANVFTMAADSADPGGKLGAIVMSRYNYDPSGTAAEVVFWRGGGGSDGEISLATNPGNTGVSATERLRITSSGSVGIGLSSPSYTLHVNGGVAGNAAYVNTSDERLKRGVASIPDALNKLTSLDGVYYYWRKNEFPEMKLSSRREMGIIAQEVEKIFPEAIFKDKKGFRSVAYSMLIAPIIESIKALKEMVFGHEEKIKRLELENQKKEKKIKELEDRLEKMEERINRPH